MTWPFYMSYRGTSGQDVLREISHLTLVSKISFEIPLKSTLSMLNYLKLSMWAWLGNYLVKIKQPRLVYPSETLNMALRPSPHDETHKDVAQGC
jgi:hypothetical protein